MSPLIVSLIGFTVWAVLTAIAIYSTYSRSLLSLPTPILAHVLGIAIPLLNALAAYVATRPEPRRSLPFAVPSPLALLALLDTVLLTLAAVDFRPQVRMCLIESHWHELFKAKDSNTIKRIQGALDCCGLRSPRDQAWPFPGGPNHADACVLRTGRETSCEPGLIRGENSAMSMLLAIAAVGLVGKALVWLLARERSTWLQSQTTISRQSASHRITDAEESANERGRYIDNPQETRLEEQDTVNGRHPEQLI